MKHLRILEETGLVVSRRDGQVKRLYLNAVPIRRLRPLDLPVQRALGHAMTSLKYHLEAEALRCRQPRRSGTSMSSTFAPRRRSCGMRSPAQLTTLYYGMDIATDLRPGAVRVCASEPDGSRKTVIAGKVLGSIRPPPGTQLRFSPSRTSRPGDLRSSRWATWYG
jgi:hypothetical protein